MSWAKPRISYHRNQKNLYGQYANPKREMQDGQTKMTSIKQEAENYIPAVTSTLDELDKISVDIDVQEKTEKEGTKDEYKYNFVMVEGKEYRVGNIVLKQLKAQLKEKPDMEFFKVTKEGTGLKTAYTVIPL